MKRPPPPPPHSASFNACIQYMCHCSRKKHHRHHHHTVQVTISQPPPPVPVEYLRQLVIEKDHQCKLQWLRASTCKLQPVRTCTAAIGMQAAASNCNLPKGMPLNFFPCSQFNGMPLGKLTIACCSVHSNGSGAGSDRL